MKKVSLFMIAAFVAVSSAFVGCEEDPIDGELTDPTVEVKATYADQSNQIIANEQTIEALQGQVATFNITFNMGADRLETVKITSTIGTDVMTVVDSTLNEGLFNRGDKFFNFTYITNFGLDPEKIEFTTTDTKDRVGTFTLTLKGTEPAPVGDFITREAILFGAQKNATYGSFYSVESGKVLNILAARTNQADVDFAYYYGDAAGGSGGGAAAATIAAPDDVAAGAIVYTSNSPAGKMSGWSTRNKTRFYALDAVATPADPTTWWAENVAAAREATETSVNQLAVGDVVFYKTDDATPFIGAFVVKAVSGTTAGTITIDLVEYVVSE